jgi:hypothetical protein
MSELESNMRFDWGLVIAVLSLMLLVAYAFGIVYVFSYLHWAWSVIYIIAGLIFLGYCPALYGKITDYLSGDYDESGDEDSFED